MKVFIAKYVQATIAIKTKLRECIILIFERRQFCFVLFDIFNCRQFQKVHFNQKLEF